MDSMTEMFYDESLGLLRDIRQGMLRGREHNWEDQEAVQEVFRGIHTLKANSNMMLYENMGELSHVLESLLYCFRGEGKKVKEPERFERLMSRYLDFFEQETDKLAEGRFPDGETLGLQREIEEFRTELTKEMSESETQEYREKLSKPRRQVFYIASASDEDMPELEENKQDNLPGASDVTPEEDLGIVEENEENEENEKKYIITEEMREKICRSARDLLRLIGNIEYSFGSGEIGKLRREHLDRLRDIQGELAQVKKDLVNTDFVPVAKKMEIVVDEMSEQLNKPVKLVVKGEHTNVDSEKREGISGALIHIIRNAVDHGIEDMDTRERLGKSPMGLIKLRFSTEDGRLKVSVKDDGAGINTQRVLEEAEKKNLLTKPQEEYSENEIYNLMLISGLTTRKEANKYSGRGVGMDVISHNVEELGGKLKISSEKGLGTTITMKF